MQSELLCYVAGSARRLEVNYSNADIVNIALIIF